MIKRHGVEPFPVEVYSFLHLLPLIRSFDLQVGVVFYLDELTDVSEESGDEVKYVA